VPEPTVDVVMDGKALAILLRSTSGPVMRHMIREGEAVKQQAKRLVGVSKPDGLEGYPNRKPRGRAHGALRASIVKRVRVGVRGPYVEVGSDDKIALWHHEGTRPHKIPLSPKPPGKWLLFKKSGVVVWAKQVRHPGTKPNRFLTNALRVLRR
jgi:hypothetical protein